MQFDRVAESLIRPKTSDPARDIEPGAHEAENRSKRESWLRGTKTGARKPRERGVDGARLETHRDDGKRRDGQQMLDLTRYLWISGLCLCDSVLDRSSGVLHLQLEQDTDVVGYRLVRENPLDTDQWGFAYDIGEADVAHLGCSVGESCVWARFLSAVVRRAKVEVWCNLSAADACDLASRNGITRLDNAITDGSGHSIHKHRVISGTRVPA